MPSIAPPYTPKEWKDNPVLVDFGDPPDWRGRLKKRDLAEVKCWDIEFEGDRLWCVELRIHHDVLQCKSDYAGWTDVCSPTMFRPSSPAGCGFTQWPVDEPSPRTHLDQLRRKHEEHFARIRKNQEGR